MSSLPIFRRASSGFGVELLLVAGLVLLDVVARLTPHEPNFTPLAASALFAGTILRTRALAFAVPVLAMMLSDFVLGPDDWRITIVIYASLTLPAVLGQWGNRFESRVVLVPLVLSSSVIFFTTTNFAVWAFSGMYVQSLDGLIRCYIAALPFLDKTVIGDLFWTAVLFGGAWLVQNGPALARRAL